MIALAKSEREWEWPEHTLADTSAAAFLNHVRFTALRCRAKARSDLFEAYAVLSVNRTRSPNAYAEALVCGLNDALRNRAVFYRPGTQEHSFDEAWLLRLAAALTHGDDASATFLLTSRIDRQHHRHIRFLVGGIAKHFRIT